MRQIACPKCSTVLNLPRVVEKARCGKCKNTFDVEITYVPFKGGGDVAKNLVAAGLAERCEIQVSYAIGVAEPTSISINTFGTGVLDESRLVELVRTHFDLRPRGLVKMLDLLKPGYRAAAAYGHFGRENSGFSWERTDLAETLRDAAGLQPRGIGQPLRPRCRSASVPRAVVRIEGL